MKGTITRLPKSGTGLANYAFIKGEDDKEYFMHASALSNHWDELKDILNREGIVHVQFDAIQAEKGPRVIKAELLDSVKVK